MSTDNVPSRATYQKSYYERNKSKIKQQRKDRYRLQKRQVLLDKIPLNYLEKELYISREFLTRIKEETKYDTFFLILTDIYITKLLIVHALKTGKGQEEFDKMYEGTNKGAPRLDEPEADEAVEKIARVVIGRELFGVVDKLPIQLEVEFKVAEHEMYKKAHESNIKTSPSYKEKFESDFKALMDSLTDDND